MASDVSTSDISDQSRRPGWLMGALRAGAMAVGVLVAFLILIRLFVASDWGRQTLTWLLQQVEIAGIGRVKVAQLQGDPLSKLQIGAMDIRSAQGVWLQADQIVLDWQPFALLQGRLKINALDIARLEIHDLPPATSRASGGRSSVALGHIGIPEIVLGPNIVALIGLDPALTRKSARFSVSGQFSWPKSAIPNFALTLDRLDRAGDHVSAKLVSEPASTRDQPTIIRNGQAARAGARHAMTIVIDAPAGGLIASLLKSPENLSLRLDGAGAQNGKFAGRLLAGGRNRAQINGGWTGPVLDWTLNAQLDALPAAQAWIRVLGDEIALHGQLNAKSPRALYRLQGKSAYWDGELGGSLLLPDFTPAGAANFSAQLNPKAPFLQNLPSELSLGAASIAGQLQLKGDLEATWSARDIQWSGGSIQELGGPISLDAEPKAGRAPNALPWRGVELGLSAKTVRMKAPAWQKLIGPMPRAQIRLRRAKGVGAGLGAGSTSASWKIEDLTVEGAALHLDSTGQLTTVAGQLPRVDFHGSLSAQGVPLATQGRANFAADWSVISGKSDGKNRSAVLKLDVRGDHFVDASPLLAAAIGPKLTLGLTGVLRQSVATTPNSKATPTPAVSQSIDDTPLDPLVALRTGLRLEIGKLLLEGRQLRLGLAGSIDQLSGYDLRTELAARGPLPIGELELVGAFTAAGHIRGAIDNPITDLRLEAPALAFGAASLRNVAFSLRHGFASGKLDLDLAAQSDAGPLTAQSALRFGRETIHLDRLEAQWAELSAQGSGVISAREASLDLSLDGTPPIMGGLLAARIQLQGPLGLSPATLSQTVLRSDILWRDFAIQGQTIARAQISANGPLSNFTVDSSVKSAVADAFFLRVFGPAQIQSPQKGGDAVASMEFHFQPALSGAVSGLKAQSDKAFDLVFGLERIRAKGRLQIAEGVVALNAEKPDARSDLAVDANWSDLKIGAFYAIFAPFIGSHTRFQGAVAGQMKAVFGQKPPVGKIEMSARNLSIKGSKVAGINLTARASLANNRLQTMLDAQGLDGLSAQWQANIDHLLREGSALALDPAGKLSGSVGLVGSVDPVWRLFGPRNIRLAGNADVHATLAGTLGDPVLHGDAVFLDGIFEEKASGVHVYDLQFRGQFDRSRLTIQSFTGTDAKPQAKTRRAAGFLSAKGEISFSEGAPVIRLDADFTRFRLVDRDFAKSDISGNVQIQADAQSAYLGGDLQIDRAEIDLNRNVDAQAPPVLQVTHINRPVSPNRAPDIANQGASLPLTLQLRVKAADRIYVRGPNFETQWQGEVTLDGSPETPNLLGRIEILRGSLDLAGRRFSFTPLGQVQFAGPLEQARLSLVATRSGPDLTAQVQITGTLAQPDFSLSSTPALPEDEILSRILFGRASATLSATEAAQLAASVTALAAGKSLTADSLFGLRTGIDIGFTPGAEGPRITGGRRISDRAYVQVSGGPSGQPEIEVEWRARRNLTLVSRFGSEGEASLALRWQKNY